MTELLIPGPANAALLTALGLAADGTVKDMLQEIARLKMAAAEGPDFAADIRSFEQEDARRRAANKKRNRGFRGLKDAEQRKEQTE